MSDWTRALACMGVGVVLALLFVGVSVGAAIWLADRFWGDEDDEGGGSDPMA